MEHRRCSSLAAASTRCSGKPHRKISSPEKGEHLKHLPIEFVTPGRFQPRRKFDQEAIQSLVDSVRERGILQPLLVRQHPDDGSIFEIIAGSGAGGRPNWPACIRSRRHP